MVEKLLHIKGVNDIRLYKIQKILFVYLDTRETTPYTIEKKTVLLKKKIDIISSFFSLSFFFFTEEDLNGLVDTISYALTDGGYFIGTTIDGERTRKLLEKGIFKFEGGHIKQNSEKEVEIMLPGTIVGLQKESFVDFSLLVSKLKERDIILSDTIFFTPLPSLTENENVLNSLYRTFVFRREKKSSLMEDINHQLLSESDENKPLLETVLKRLTITEFSDCTDRFMKLCRKVEENGIEKLSIRFPYKGRSQTTMRIHRGEKREMMRLFELGYFTINLLEESPQHFYKTYGCINGGEMLLTHFPFELPEETPFFENKRLTKSILDQIYQINKMLSDFNCSLNTSVILYQNKKVKELYYKNSEKMIEVIDGWIILVPITSIHTEVRPFSLEELPILVDSYRNYIDEFEKYIVEKYDVKKITTRLPKKMNIEIQEGDDRITMRGIRNLGSTCYLSSSLQAITNANQIVKRYCGENKIIKDDALMKEFSKIVCQLTRTISNMKTIPAVEEKNVKEFKNEFDKLEHDMKGNQQEDASEFVSVLLDNLSERDSYINELYNIEIQQDLECTECHTRRELEPSSYKNLSLPISTEDQQYDSLDEVLLKYTQKEIIDRRCNICGNSKSYSWYKISKTSPLFTVSLNRFDNKLNKIEHHVSITEEIEVGQKKYELYAAVRHYGDILRRGHYAAYIKHSGEWYIANDSTVNKVTFSEVNKQPYIIFYREI
jgi:ubiquitin C-terminal hydrolase